MILSLRALAIATLLLASSAALGQQEAETHVLFLGNSYTGVNDLPGMFQALAASGGHTVVEDSNTPGGKTLGSSLSSTPHMSLASSLDKIALGGWDFVVLQEQSVTPMINFTKNQFMIPGVASLDASIKASNPDAVTLLYQTWARKNPGVYCWGSWCSVNFSTFEAMQDKVSLSYDQAALPVGASISPVGEAWRLYRQENPTGNLFSGDGSHPNAKGTYLAACTFYAAIFDQSPIGLTFTSTVSAADAAVLQDVAARTWFGPTCGLSKYGQGLGGANTMQLVGSGSTSVGDAAQAVVGGLPAGATEAWFIVAFDTANLPLFGGTLLVDLDLALPFFLVPDGPGGPTLSLPIPANPALAGLEVYLQAAATDAGAPAGWALSDGLRLEVCP